MNRKAFLILLSVISAVLILIMCLSPRSERADEKSPLPEVRETASVFAVVEGGAASQRISPYFKDEEAYFFLPAFADRKKLTLGTADGARVVLNGQEIGSSYVMDAGSLPGDLEIYRGDSCEKYTLNCMWSEKVPAVFIETGSGDMTAVDSDKEVVDEGRYTVIDGSGHTDGQGSLDFIHARGNSSFQAEKKSYRIKLSEKDSLLGLPSDRSFILQANAYDNTDIRNALAFSLAEKWGMDFIPRYVQTDLYLNGGYAGAYTLMESIKVTPERINIAGDGGYLFEVVHDEKRLDDDSFAFMCGGEVHLRVLYPEKLTATEKQYTESHMNRINDMIEELGKDESTAELENYLDLDSFARMYLFNFVTNDIDAGNYSSYLYIDPADKKVHLGPVWDYDKAWGNEYKKNGLPEFNSYSYRWPEILSDNREMRERIRLCYEGVSPVTDMMRAEGILGLADEVRESAAMDRVRWGNLSSQSVDTGSFDTDVEQLAGYYGDRLSLLEDVLYKDDLCKVFIKGPSGRLFWVKKGEGLSKEQLDFARKLFGSDKFFLPSGEEVDETAVFVEDTVIKPENM